MAGCLILRAPVEIHDNVAAVLIAADIEAVRVSLTGVGKGVEVGDAA